MRFGGTAYDNSKANEKESLLRLVGRTGGRRWARSARRPLIVPTFGVFLKPLSQEFGWSRTQISLAFSLFTLGATITLPLIGRLVDRFGARKVIVSATLLFGLGVLSLSFLSAHLWHFYAVYLFLGIVGSGTTPVPYTKVISRWFDRQRGLALGLAAATFSVSASLMPPVTQVLIAAVGWRHAYEILGLLAMAITVPVVVLLLKESPQMMGLAPDGEPFGPAEVVNQPSLEAGMSPGGEADRALLAHGRRIFPDLGGLPWMCRSPGALAH